MQEFHAIYENGVLRPLTPLGLPESTEVVATVRPASGREEMNLAQESPDPLLGLLADDSALLDEIVEEAMLSRETQPFRISE
jgi:predicted DNA-binding antitoxin AbrB/MazE fold protein